MALEAVVFDFDGLIIDSEWLIYETAQAAFAAHGHDLGIHAWATIIGTNDETTEGWWDSVCAAAGVTGFDRVQFEEAYQAQPREGRDELPPLPGVVELIDELGAASVPIGIASSSPVAWLHRHLGRLGLLDRFGAVIGADLVDDVGKPEPDVYLRACSDLGADPARSIAIEDSANGATAAKAAGMAVVAVPSQITRFNDFSHVDLVVDSVADLSLDKLRSLLPDGGEGVVEPSRA